MFSSATRFQGMRRHQRFGGEYNTDGGKPVMRRSGSEYKVDNNNTPTTFVCFSNNIQQHQQGFFDDKKGGDKQQQPQQLRQLQYRQHQQQNLEENSGTNNKIQHHQRRARASFTSNNRRESNRINRPEVNISSQKEDSNKNQLLNCTDEQNKDQQPSPTGYNFEEHVEEFPALNLSQSNSRKASECLSECQQQQPSPSSPPKFEQQQKHQSILFPIKQPFSAVVAGNCGRPRRATIGTSTCNSNIGINENKDEQQGEEKYFQQSTQPRSDTISGGGGQHQRRSYAQVMLKRSGGSGVKGAEKERSSAATTEKKGKEENESKNNSDYPLITSTTIGTEV
jgi:hypothetical protein